MVLNALPRHHEALALYEAEGFRLDKWTGEDEDHGNPVHMRVNL